MPWPRHHLGPPARSIALPESLGNALRNGTVESVPALPRLVLSLAHRHTSRAHLCTIPAHAYGQLGQARWATERARGERGRSRRSRDQRPGYDESLATGDSS